MLYRRGDVWWFKFRFDGRNHVWALPSGWVTSKRIAKPTAPTAWSHDKGVPGKVVAKLMGHTNADVTLNVYTQAMDDSLRTAVDRVGNELFNIVHSDEGRLDSVPLAASEASRGATGGQPESHE